MIAQVLPGLRDFRTPFSAGLLWILALWLLLRRHVVIDSESNLSGFASEIAELLAPMGLGLGFGLAAYLVGSALEFTWSLPWRLVPAVSRKGLRSINTLVEKQLADLPHDEVIVMAWSRSLSARESIEFAVETDAEVQRNLESRVAQSHSRARDAQEAVDSPRASGRGRQIALSLAPVEALKSVSEASDALWRSIELRLRKDLVLAVRDELEIVGTRLLGKHASLFDISDRLQAEAEFRLAIMPPLATGAVVALSSYVPDWALGVTALAIVTLFVGQAAQRRMSAGDRIADALLLGVIEAPTLEQLRPGVFVHDRVRDGELRAATAEQELAEHQVLGMPLPTRGLNLLRSLPMRSFLSPIFVPLVDVAEIIADGARALGSSFRDAFQFGRLNRSAFSLRYGARRGSADALISLGDLYRTAGNLARAREAYQQAGFAGSAEGYFRLGDLAKLTGNRTDALLAYRRAATMADTDDQLAKAQHAYNELTSKPQGT